MQSHSTARQIGRTLGRVPALLAASAALALVLVAGDAHAQVFPSQPAVTEPVPTAERTLIDAPVFVSPPDRPGLCLPLGPGTLTMTARRTDDAIEQRPALLRVDGFQDDPGTHLTMQISQDETTVTKHVAGSYHYCWSIDVDAPESEHMATAQRGAFVQTVAIRITHRPD